MITVAFCGFTLALVLLMRLAPQSSAARLLHRQLIEMPLDKLAKFRSHHLLYAVILPLLVLGGGEILIAAGSDFIFVYAMDLAIYFDAMLVTYALAAVAMARGSLRYARLRLRKGRRVRRLLAARRRRRAAPARRALPPANDDDRPVALPLAA